MIEMIINRCLKNQLLVMVSYQSPFYITQNIIGDIIEVNKDRQNIRIHMHDFNTKSPLYDDTLAKQMITLPLEHINFLQPLFWTKSTTQAKQMMFSDLSTPFLDDLYSYEQKITPLKSSLNSKDIALNVAIFKNVLSVKHKGKIIPILSKRIVYDYTQKTFKEEETFTHKDSNLNKLFKFSPDFTDINTVKQALIKTVDCNEEPYYFTQKAMLNTQLVHAVKPSPTRPVKAYLNTLKLNNLGRKDYLLSPIKSKDSIIYEQVIEKLFSDPMSITVFDQVKPDFIDQLYENLLMNQTNTLVIGDTNTAFNHHYPVLKLDDYHSINKALDYYKSFEQTTLKKPLIKPLSKVKFDAAINSANLFSDRYLITSRLLSLAHHLDAFDFSIQLASYIDTLLKKPVTVPIDYLVKKHNQSSKATELINYTHYMNHQKLSLKAYKPIKELITMKASQRRKNQLLSYINQPHMLALLKQLFPLIMIPSTQSLALSYKAFDTVVLVDPTMKDAYKLYYADKALIIDTVYKTHPMLDKPLSKHLLKHENPAIHFHTDLSDWTSPYKVVENTLYKDRLQAIEGTLNSTGMNVGMKTPFLKEKKILKKRFKPVNPQTLTNPTQSFHTVTSLGIQSKTIKKAYDWLKQHPDLIDHLTLKSVTMHADVDAIKTLSDGHDYLVKWIEYYQLDLHLSHVNSVIKAVVNACLKSPKYLEIDVRFERIFKHLNNVEIKRIDYVLWKDDGEPDLIVLTNKHTHNEETLETIHHYAQRQGFEIIIINLKDRLFTETLLDVLIATQKCKRW